MKWGACAFCLCNGVSDMGFLVRCNLHRPHYITHSTSCPASHLPLNIGLEGKMLGSY